MKSHYYAYLIIATIAILLTPSLAKTLFVAPVHTQYELTHDEALTLCEALDMVYDYEAEGYTTADFCMPTMD